MGEKEKMLASKLYIAKDEQLGIDNRNARKLTRLFNQTTEDQFAYRIELLKELFHKTGENIWVEPTFHCDYGCHISVGENFYANYDCVIVDVCKVNIGDDVLFGPRVCLYTAGHPIDAEIRSQGLEFGKPITIKDKVWIGGSTIINPGVTIGHNVVIGSGSVVTKDIPDNVVAAGNPCRVLRPINEADEAYWGALREEYFEDCNHGI